MSDYRKWFFCIPQHPPRAIWLIGSILVAAAVVVGFWVGVGRKMSESVSQAGGAAERGGVPKSSKPHGAEKLGLSGSGVDETSVSGSHPSPQSSAGTSRQPLQFRAKPVEPAAVLGVLASGKQTVAERVRQLQGMRGISFSKEERDSALVFLAGKEVPEGMGKSSTQWLADELLTALRLQEPPWDGLAGELAKVAFQPETDPVVRDYIMQHLGHLWEQYGAREEIETALWKAVATTDETTPGTALIALSRGYGRDEQAKSLEKVRQRAFELARNPATSLATRVTALAIAGEGGGREVKELAETMAKNPQTPVILQKVAARMGR